MPEMLKLDFCSLFCLLFIVSICCFCYVIFWTGHSLWAGHYKWNSISCCHIYSEGTRVYLVCQKTVNAFAPGAKHDYSKPYCFNRTTQNKLCTISNPAETNVLILQALSVLVLTDFVLETLIVEHSSEAADQRGLCGVQTVYLCMWVSVWKRRSAVLLCVDCLHMCT